MFTLSDKALVFFVLSTITGLVILIKSRANTSKETEETSISSISDQDLQTIKTIFSIDTFFSTETIPYKNGVLFKGKLKEDPETAHKFLSSKLQEHFHERYSLFLVEGDEEKPVIIIIPNTDNHRTMTILQKNIAIILFIATIVTSLEKTSSLLGFDLFSNWYRYKEIVPITLALWVILVFHEIGLK